MFMYVYICMHVYTYMCLFLYVCVCLCVYVRCFSAKVLQLQSSRKRDPQLKSDWPKHMSLEPFIDWCWMCKGLFYCGSSTSGQVVQGRIKRMVRKSRPIDSIRLCPPLQVISSSWLLPCMKYCIGFLHWWAVIRTCTWSNKSYSLQGGFKNIFIQL